MQNPTLQKYSSNDIAKLAEFLEKYLEKYPDAKLGRPELYTYHPALESGDNVFCVLDSRQQMIGFAPLFPVITTDANAVNGPHELWTIILASPDLDEAQEVRDLLFGAVVERVTCLKAVHGLSQAKLAADMMVSQKEDIEYLLQKGFEPFEQISVMCSESSQTPQEVSVPTELTFRQSKLISEEEQGAYLKVYNVCFPELPKTAEELQFLLQSPLWEKGMAMMAYSSSNELAGSILVYWDEQKGHAVTDDVMVLPHWRGRNIAKRLIGEGLNYSRAQGFPEVLLEVKASNGPAVSVYTSMGYSVINQESLLGKYI